MTTLSPHAISHEALLIAIRDSGAPTIKDLAIAAGRDNDKNMARDLGTLEGAGLIVRPEGALPALTELGAAALRTIDFHEGRLAGAEAGLQDLPAGYLPLRHADLWAATEKNARQLFDPGEIASLAHTMATKGLRQMIQVLPAGPDGLHEIVAGERRWRAWGHNIKTGVWPADHAELVRIDAMDEATRLEVALIENLQRVDLNHVELGRGYKMLLDKGHSTAAIAAIAGEKRTQEHVQQHLRILQHPPEYLDRMTLKPGEPGYVSLHQALEDLRPPPPKPPLLNTRRTLVLIELARHAQLHPSEVGGEPGYTRLARPPTGGPVDDLFHAKLINLRPHNGAVYAKVKLHSTQAGEYLTEIGFDADPEGTLRKHRAEVLGGELFASQLEAQGRWWTPELNPPAEETRTAFAPAEPAHRPMSPPPGLNLAPPPPEMTAKARLTLLEIAHKIGAATITNMAGRPAAEVQRSFSQGEYNASGLIIDHKMLMFTPGPKGHLVVSLTDTAQAWFNEQGYPRGERGPGVTDGDLYDARVAVVGEDFAGEYASHCVTPWLNPEAAPAVAMEDLTELRIPDTVSLDDLRAELRDDIAAVYLPDIHIDHLPVGGATAADEQAGGAASASGYVSDLGRQALRITAETRAMQLLDAAAEQAAILVEKAITKRLDDREARSVVALIQNAREAAKPFVQETA